MCGFAGVFDSPVHINGRKASAIAGEVCFRGPDDRGIRIYDEEMQPAETGPNMMFFNRLAIIDLEARSNQPFEDERYTLIFNGEIYNFMELKPVLQKAGYMFRTTSDTEVLFYALQEWGTGALDKLNGMFSFCWVDRKLRRFLLARDRMGIKPMYYRQYGKSLAFGSELDSVLRLSVDRPEIESASVHMYLWMQFIPTPGTIIKGICKLPPGHYLEGSLEDIRTMRPLAPVSFWDAYAQQVRAEAGPAAGDLETILTDSLSRQLVADVPLGLFLSSGVDSSLLAALVNKHFAGSQRFNFFTVAFTEATASDESEDALQFIRGFNNPNLVSHTLEVDAGFAGDHLDNLYDYFDEPFGDPTSILNWVISRKAKEFVTVALSGDGADELFWGYNRYDQWRRPSLQLPGGRTVRGWLAPLAGGILPGKYRRSKAALTLEGDRVNRHFTLFLPPELKHLTDRPVWEKPIWAMDGIEKIRNKEDMTAWLDIKTYLADAMLYKVDRASMAASLEVRVPYLDNKVVDYALALPFSRKSDNLFRHKSVLKQLLQGLAPHYDISRPKKGFNFPLDRWLRFEWKEKVLSLLDKNNLRALGLDDEIYLPLVRQYYAGDKRYALSVWYLFNLALWHRKYKNIIPLGQAL